jgi:predicted ribosome quality control (RQC) complex YloA/Tae2 family protein
VLPGREYIAPPTQGKTNPKGVQQEDFLQLVTDGNVDTKLTDLLLHNFDGFSPRMCREVVYRTGLPLSITLNHCGEYELSLLWQHFQPFSNALIHGDFKPTMVFKPNGAPLDFAAFELTQYQQHQTQNGSMNELLDEFHSLIHYQQQLQAKGQSVLAIISRDISRLKNKLPKYRQSLQQADRGEEYRIYGELLTANMYRLEKGMANVEVENFYSPDMDKIVIPLELQKTPSQNVQAYFKKYVKAKNTLTAVTEQLEQTQQELAYLESVETAIRNSSTLEDLEEIHGELVTQGYAKPQVGKKPVKQKEKPQPLKFMSSDGWAIWVGKNNRQNDYLTTRWAKPEDLWFHTKDIPGSHVVIRTDGHPVPPTTLSEAALLAAYHSKAKHSNQVPVDYTLIKHVHKPNGAKPGMVIYVNQQTLYTTPDEQTVQKLVATENNAGRG